MGQYGGEEGWFLAFITCLHSVLFYGPCTLWRKCRRTQPTPNPRAPAAAGNRATGPGEAARPPHQGPSHQIDHKLAHQLAQLELVRKEYKESVGLAGFMNTPVLVPPTPRLN